MTTKTRKCLLFIGGALLLLLMAGSVWASLRLKPMLRERLVTAVREQYKREVEIKDLRISLVPFSAVGEGFVLHQKDRSGLPPLATIEKLRVEAGLRGILAGPLRIERLTLEGLQLNIPPKRKDPDKDDEPKREPPRFIIGEVIADGTVLQIRFSKRKARAPSSPSKSAARKTSRSSASMRAAFSPESENERPSCQPKLNRCRKMRQSRRGVKPLPKTLINSARKT